MNEFVREFDSLRILIPVDWDDDGNPIGFDVYEPEKLKEEPEPPRETIFRCQHCGERIRFGETCTVVWHEEKYAFVHARCYGEWWQNGEENIRSRGICPTRMVK